MLVRFAWPLELLAFFLDGIFQRSDTFIEASNLLDQNRQLNCFHRLKGHIQHRL